MPFGCLSYENFYNKSWRFRFWFGNFLLATPPATRTASWPRQSKCSVPTCYMSQLPVCLPAWLPALWFARNIWTIMFRSSLQSAPLRRTCASSMRNCAGSQARQATAIAVCRRLCWTWRGRCWCSNLAEWNKSSSFCFTATDLLARLRRTYCVARPSAQGLRFPFPLLEMNSRI